MRERDFHHESTTPSPEHSSEGEDLAIERGNTVFEEMDEMMAGAQEVIASASNIREDDAALPEEKEQAGALKDRTQRSLDSIRRAVNHFLRAVFVAAGVTLPAHEIIPKEEEPKIFEEDFQHITEKARIDLERDGITEEQRAAYTSMSERIYRNINPREYPHDLKDLYARFVVPMVSDARQEKDPFTGWEVVSESYRLGNRTKEYHPGREDVWRLYLGLPQQHGTFGISDYRPSRRSSDSTYYYSIPAANDLRLYEFLASQSYYYKNQASLDEFNAKPKSDEDEEGLQYYYSENKIMLYDEPIMGHYKLEEGDDERGHYVAYYDRWDLQPRIPGLGKVDMSFIGKPLEIYDRIYFPKGTKATYEDLKARLEFPDGRVVDL